MPHVGKALNRFLRYSVIGFSTFLFDLFLLYLFTEFGRMNPVVAAGVAFLIAVTLNYFLSRHYVFPETERGVTSGYYWFIIIALVGMVAVTGLMFVFVQILQWHYLLSRIGIAAIVGIWNYGMNLFLNFKVAGQ